MLHLINDYLSVVEIKWSRKTSDKTRSSPLVRKYLLCNEIKGVMIRTLNDGTDILMVRTLSVKNQKKLRNRKEIWSVSQPFTWLPMFFLRITYLKPMPLKTCSILTLHQYRGGGRFDHPMYIFRCQQPKFWATPLRKCSWNTFAKIFQPSRSF